MAPPLSSPIIGVLTPLDAAFSTLFLRGIERAARTFGTRYVSYGTPWIELFDDVGLPSAPLSCLGYDPARLSGTILCFGSVPLVQHVGSLHRAGHPCVLALRSAGDTPHVMIDDERQIAALVERFYRHGHRRIAFFYSEPTNPSAQRRYRGYRTGLEQVGISFDPGLVFAENAKKWVSENVAQTRSASGPPFTALVTFNDNDALAALNAFQAHGLRVPDDIEIAGFDNAPATTFSDPPLTTFQLPMEKVAFACFEKMMGLIRGGKAEVPDLLPPLFIQRGSTRFQDKDPKLDTAPLAPLRPEQDPRLLALAETVPASAPFTQTLAATKAAVHEGIRRGLDVDGLAALIATRTAGPKPAGTDGPDTAFAEVLDLVSATAQTASNYTLERSRLLHFLTMGLRRTSLETLDEALVLKILRQVLAAFGFSSARLHLQTGADDAQADTVYRWDLNTDEEHRVELARKDLPVEIADFAESRLATHVITLSTAGTVVGHLITEGESSRTDELTEIIRYLSNALHGIRLYGQLARSHQTLRESEARLRETQRDLVEMSRRAGIAEIATGVLHNVGNALNAVNTSAGVVSSRIGKLRFEPLAKIEQLLLRADEPWGDLFQSHERGRKLVEFIHTLDAHMRQERADILQEVQALREGVEHINQIVASQQQFAQVAGLVEEFDPVEAPEYALRLCETELLRHGITVIREFQSAPAIRIERHKAVQVLVNLIRNAKESLTQAQQSRKTLVVGLRVTPAGQVQCYVTDNGGGIAPEHLGRMFSMGFSTKKGGHGFGLHNSALIASSLGGTLEAHSDGLGHGATFVLTLPAAGPAS